MKNARKLSAEQVMNEDPVTVSTEQSLAQIKNRMEENELRAVPVLNEEGDFRGAIGYRDLVRFIQFNPKKTKPEKVLHQPPEFEADQNLVELADLRINSGRKMLVKVSGDTLHGVIGDQEFAEAFTEVKEFKNVSTRDIHSFELEQVFEEDTLEKARHRMLDENISRLPVVDNNGKLTGMLSSMDVLGAMIVTESQDPGGTSGRRAGRKEVNIAGGGEKQEMSDITVDQLMDRTVNTSSQHLKGVEALKQMLDHDRFEIVFMDEKYPESIVTLKDFIDYLAGLAPGNTILVSLTGLELPEEKAAIHNTIKKQLQGSLGRKIDRPEELSLRVKKSEKDGKKHRWELDMKLYSEYGVISVNEEGWELLDAVDEALDELNRIVRDEHGKMTDHSS